MRLTPAAKRPAGTPVPAPDTPDSMEFLALMRDLLFIPHSPTPMNAGTPGGQLSACFVLPVEASLQGIFSTLAAMALIHQSGGGTGFSFSHLRPAGHPVSPTRGVAGGPLPCIRVFDEARSAVKQGGGDGPGVGWGGMSTGSHKKAVLLVCSVKHQLVKRIGHVGHRDVG